MEQIISSYSRKEAIDDGVLADISHMAREAGFRFPVAITSGVLTSLEPTTHDLEAGQSRDGRLWDLLSMLKLAIRRAEGSQVDFSMLVWRSRYGGKAMKEEFRSICGPGDDMEPVITIMLPHED